MRTNEYTHTGQVKEIDRLARLIIVTLSNGRTVNSKIPYYLQNVRRGDKVTVQMQSSRSGMITGRC